MLHCIGRRGRRQQPRKAGPRLQLQERRLSTYREVRGLSDSFSITRTPTNKNFTLKAVVPALKASGQRAMRYRHSSHRRPVKSFQLGMSKMLIRIQHLEGGALSEGHEDPPSCTAPNPGPIILDP